MTQRKRYVALFGSRSATREDVLNAVQSLKLVPKHHVIVSGGARGADAHAKAIAEEWGFEYVEVPAFWSRGKGAGFARNQTMVDLVDAGVGVWDGSSPGTKDTIEKFKKAEKKCEVFVAMHGLTEVEANAPKTKDELAEAELDEAQQMAMAADE